MNKKNKFNAIKVEYDGFVFDSKKEAEYYLYLKSRLKTGHIIDLQIHLSYEVIPANDIFKAVYYIADFVYKEPDGYLHVDDVKGLKKGASYQIFKIKQKLMYDKYGIEVKEV